MNEYKLVPDNHPVLRNPAEEFDFSNPPIDPAVLFGNMVSVMCENRGVGLAAPQLGLPYRVFIVGNPDEPEKIIPVFNPRIVDVSEEEVLIEEGCLTFPGLFIKVKRPALIKVRYANHHGNTNTIKFEGYTARIFLHEYDHLNGTVFTERASSFHLNQAIRQKKKLDRKKKNANS